MSELDTGVKDAHVADADGTEPEIDDETMLPSLEDSEPEGISLAELLGEDEPEKVEKSGADNPPDETKPEQKQETPTFAPDTSKAFAKRLSDEKRKMESSLGVTLEEARELVLEMKARKLMESNTEMNMTLDVAKMIVKGQQPAPPPQQTEPEADEGDQTVAAWKQSLIDQAPAVKAVTGMEIGEYALQHPLFEAALKAGNTPLQAMAIEKSIAPVLKQQTDAAAANAQKEMLKGVKDSNARAVTPINAKTGGKPRSLTDMMADMTIEEMDRLVLEAERKGKKLRLD